MKEAIRQRALKLGFDDCRFTTAEAPESSPRFQNWLRAGCHGDMGYLQRNADKRIDPQQVLPGARSVIALAASYEFSNRQSAIGNQQSGVTARYARFDDYHNVLGEQLKELAAFVNQFGGDDTRSFWYVDTGPVLERDLARRAGLGFIGKHTNVISRKFGNWLLLGEILTTLEIEPDESEKNRCGSCTRCITACPTRAITSPFQLDARLCISYLTIELKGPIPVELRPAVGNRIFGCDDCLAVCPWNRFAREGNLMKQHSRPDLASLDLIALLKLDEAGFKSRFAGTPILRAKQRGFLRNVCVALGNTGDETALSALKKTASASEPLVAEHARWAAARIEERVKKSVA